MTCKLQLLPRLQPGQHLLVPVVQDECCFYSHDDKSHVWLHERENILHKKGQGATLMASEYICECHGPLKLPDDMVTALTAAGHSLPAPCSRVLFRAGKSYDGNWDNERMMQQLQSVLTLFEVLHPAWMCWGFPIRSQHHPYGVFIRCSPHIKHGAISEEKHGKQGISSVPRLVRGLPRHTTGTRLLF